MRPQRHRMVCLLLVAAAACRVGPDRGRVAPIELPEAFTSADAAAVAPPDEWWHTFGDPVLVEFVERALAANHDLAAATARVVEARALAGIADAGHLPGLSLAADRQWLYASRQAAGLAGAGVRSGLVPRNQDVHRIGVDASWEIDLFGAVQRRVEAAEAHAEAALASLQAVGLLVAGEVASTYLDLRFAQRRLAVVEARVASLQASADLAAELWRSGLGDESAARAAEAAWRAEQSKPTLLAAEIRAANHRLAVLLGELPERLVVPAPTVEPEPPPDFGLGVPAELLRRRPDLRQAEADVAAATAAVGVATADLYPRLFLLGSAGLESQRFDRLLGSGALQAIGGPSLQLPLFQGGALRQALVAAEARQQAALARFAQRVLTALADVEIAADRLRVDREQLVDAQRASQAASRLAQLAGHRGAIGLADRAQVLLAQRQHLESAERLLLARNATAQSAVALFKAVGGGF